MGISGAREHSPIRKKTGVMISRGCSWDKPQPSMVFNIQSSSSISKTNGRNHPEVTALATSSCPQHKNHQTNTPCPSQESLSCPNLGSQTKLKTLGCCEDPQSFASTHPPCLSKPLKRLCQLFSLLTLSPISLTSEPTTM